jgi:hypothetical protein
MSKLFNILVSRYFAIAFAGAVFAATGAQAGPSNTLRMASTDDTAQPEQPARIPQASSAPASETTTQRRPVAIMHLSKKEAEIVRELHRHGIYW